MGDGKRKKQFVIEMDQEKLTRFALISFHAYYTIQNKIFRKFFFFYPSWCHRIQHISVRDVEIFDFHLPLTLNFHCLVQNLRRHCYWLSYFVVPTVAMAIDDLPLANNIQLVTMNDDLN